MIHPITGGVGLTKALTMITISSKSEKITKSKRKKPAKGHLVVGRGKKTLKRCSATGDFKGAA